MKNVLTLSGGVITDVERINAASWGINQQGGSVDTPPSNPSGIAVWEAGTNLMPHAQCDSLGSWTAPVGVGTVVVIDPTTPAPFSPQSIKVTTPGTVILEGEGANSIIGLAAAAGTVAAGSIYANIPVGVQVDFWVRWVHTDSTTVDGVKTTVTGTGAWMLIAPATAAVDVAKIGDSIFLYGRTHAIVATTFYLAHPMIQEGVNVVSPYVATSGGATATRAAGRVQAPASLLNATQGWFAVRLVVGQPGGSITGRIMSWRNSDSSGGTELFYNGSSIALADVIASTQKTSVTTPYTASHLAGELHTIVGYWTATEMGISLDGSAFTKAITRATAGIPVITNPLIDIGRYAVSTSAWMDSTILWAACGTGTLTNADAATIAATPNNTPPHAYIPSTAQLTGSFPLWGYGSLQTPIQVN